MVTVTNRISLRFPQPSAVFDLRSTYNLNWVIIFMKYVINIVIIIIYVYMFVWVCCLSVSVTFYHIDVTNIYTNTRAKWIDKKRWNKVQIKQYLERVNKLLFCFQCNEWGKRRKDDKHVCARNDFLNVIDFLKYKLTVLSV